MKKIRIDHLARVEGAGGITATIDGNVVSDVKFFVNEGPRLFERFTIGKTPDEDVNLVPRICAICSVSHKYAAIRGLEKALSVKVTPRTVLLRELMHLGEMVESHSLHTYLLALPDYLGFPNAIAMAAEYAFEAKIGLEMKEFGNHIMKTMAGRFIHGENPVIGGFGKVPSRDELVWIKNRAVQFMPFALKTAQLFAEIDYPDIPESETLYACCHPAGNAFGYVGDEILVSNGDKIDVQDYKKLTNEFVVSHSFCKRSQYKGKPYSVGALARVNNLGERLTGEAGKMYNKYFNERWKKNPLFNNAAQALEILYCFERIPHIIDEALALPHTERVIATKDQGKGASAVEAPRGTLFHAYEVTKGRITHADIITPTAQNAEDIERYCFITAQELLNKGEEAKIKDRMDLVVRSFDPCISCSAHMVQVKTAPAEDWRQRLAEIKKQGAPLFIGLGKTDRSDDGVGLVLAAELRQRGVDAVWLETEIEKDGLSGARDSSRPCIFLDSVDFGEEPGKVVLLPLLHVAWTSVLSHRLSPFVTADFGYERLKTSYILGIQPGSIVEGETLTECVKQAAEKVLETLSD